MASLSKTSVLVGICLKHLDGFRVHESLYVSFSFNTSKEITKFNNEVLLKQQNSHTL